MPAGATYEPIATTTLGSNATSITFSAISSSYTDLVLVFVGRATTSAPVYVQFNTDTASNYSDTYIYGDGTSATSVRNSSKTSINVNYWGIATNSGDLTMLKLNIFNYAGSTNKTMLSEVSNRWSGGDVERSVHLWRNTAAINSIKLFIVSNSYEFYSGTTATLYGIKAA
jgi:hypothetical protein